MVVNSRVLLKYRVLKKPFACETDLKKNSETFLKHCGCAKETIFMESIRGRGRLRVINVSFWSKVELNTDDLHESMSS